MTGFPTVEVFEQLEIQVANGDSLVILSENQGITVKNVTNLEAGDFSFPESATIMSVDDMLV